MNKTTKIQDLPKSTNIIDKNSFLKIYELLKDHYWIEDEYEAFIELWNLCDYEQQQELIISLLRKFTFLNSRDLTKYCKDISDQICDNWKISNKSTKIVALSDNKRPDGSQFIIQAIKNKFSSREKWTEDNFRNSLTSIGEASYQLRNNQTLILIDDFIGTGKTVERKVLWLKGKINEKQKSGVKIFLISVACMEFALDKINKLDIVFYSPLILKKGITDFFKNEDIKLYFEHMINIESKLQPFFKGEPLPSLGHGKSESLFAIEGINVPNNVFPVFWWPLLKGEIERNTIFKRIR